MDITPTTINTITTTPQTAKSPEPESETPTRNQPSKPFPSSNGVPKRHPPHHHQFLSHHLAGQQFPSVVYKECLKNHAASLGGHAVDGCGEFMPSPSATSTDPTSLKCAACGCHRNFHRREPEDQAVIPATHVLAYQPHHRHHPPPPQQLPAPNRSPNSASPPPISSSYFPSAPHMLLALSSGLSAPPENLAPSSHVLLTPNSSTRKRFRTKFSQEQKDKMYQFAERVGWKLQKIDDDLVQEFCHEIGVDRGVFKVWMHNNKNTLRKRDFHSSRSIHELEHEHITNSSNEMDGNNITNTNNGSSLDPNHYQNDSGGNIGTNGSSSSS